MKFGLTVLILLMQLTSTEESFAQKTAANFKWDQLPPIPDAVGYAGSFAGVSNGALIVAGGANFPDGGAPWTGSVKKWHDKIFVLEKGASEWKEVGKLPRPLGYGVSVSNKDGLVCLGGSNESGHFADVFVIKYKNGSVTFDTLPSMPKPNANSCGVLIDDKIYIAGGTEATDSKSSESIFWSFDLSKSKWEELSTWPGPSRMLSVSGTSKDEFYLFSGAKLTEGKREYLTDAYKYTPGKGWCQLADLPTSVVAAPSTAFTSDKNHLLVFGGDDGKLAAVAATLKEKHEGFSKDILSYNIKENNWNVAGQIFTDKKEDAGINPNGSVWAPVTTPLVVWNGNVILPGGEVRPATRTNRVLQATPVKTK
ncbi:MAG: Kelch repeat-containing protein [Sphingobacteriaceae bacterium]